MELKINNKMVVSENSLTIIRQNALTQANKWLENNPNKDHNLFFEFAKECEEWVLRGDQMNQEEMNAYLLALDKDHIDMWDKSEEEWLRIITLMMSLYSKLYPKKAYSVIAVYADIAKGLKIIEDSKKR